MAWSATADGSAEFFNRRWLDFTGLTTEEALEWGWKDAIHRDDLSRLIEIFHGALKLGRSFEVEGRLRHKDGEFRWFLFRASPMCDESGRVIKWYGTNTDIEDLKLAEEALRKSEERWRAVFENSAIGVALTDLRILEITCLNTVFAISSEAELFSMLLLSAPLPVTNSNVLNHSSGF